MKRSKKIIIANWKMNPRTIDEAKEMFRKIRAVAKELRKVQTIVCPPFIFLSEMSRLVNSGRLVLGAQDVFWKTEGAYTGEISPLQLTRLDVNYVIIGHSERRALGETDEIVNRKTKACLENNMTVIMCIGETKRDADGDYFHFVKEQLKNSLNGISKKDVVKLVITYEPVWAISSHKKGADNPAGVLEMSIYIRKVLSDIFDKKSAMAIPIIYGGSANEKNSESFLVEGEAQGLLVGSASLDPRAFGNILKIADRIRN